MICVPSNPRLPYLWKIACFSKEGAECRWRGWWWITERLHHCQGLLQPHTSPSWQRPALWSQPHKNHLMKQWVVLVQEFLPETNLACSEGFAWQSYPAALHWVCLFPWVFLVTPVSLVSHWYLWGFWWDGNSGLSLLSKPAGTSGSHSSASISRSCRRFA